ncbi:MAG: integration host factor subunit alpha [Deltaproteobacteria bacterium]|nr:integration host factor subunit alpha [Deltaproteobacteria bacterium]
MTLTKEAISQEVSKKGFTRKRSVALVESLLEMIKASLERGEEVLISGFGKFYVRKKAERMGRNPKTGLEAVVSERRVVRFRCSPVLRDKLK